MERLLWQSNILTMSKSYFDNGRGYSDNRIFGPCRKCYSDNGEATLTIEYLDHVEKATLTIEYFGHVEKATLTIERGYSDNRIFEPC
jgi:hypothetical protein